MGDHLLLGDLGRCPELVKMSLSLHVVGEVMADATAMQVVLTDAASAMGLQEVLDDIGGSPTEGTLSLNEA